MKNKINKLVFVLVIIMMLLITNVYAAGAQIKLTGGTEIKPKETATLKLKLETGEEAVGVISGKIEINENITEVQVVGLNNWQLTYNTATGEFNALKAEGATNEEFAEIKCTIKEDGTGKAILSITNIEYSTIGYEDFKFTNVTKELSIIGNNTEDDKQEDNTEDDNKEDNKQDDNKQEDTKPEDTKQEETKPEDNQPQDNKPQDSKPTNTQTTNPQVKPSVLPKAGAPVYVIISIIILLGSSIFCYIKCKSYKKI